jgi:hypothetical protein
MSSFITFGCWNKWYCNPGTTVSNPLSVVIATMDEFITTLNAPPAFICIAGDNYYPDIRTDSPIEGEEKKRKKTKTLSVPDLQSGFECLSEFQKRHRSIPIDIIAGNHDIEGTKKMIVTQIPGAPVTEPCIITKAEIESTIHHRNLNFTMFNYRIINNTLVIMLDSNIYCETLDAAELECYALLVDHTLFTLKLEKLHGPPITHVEQLKALQQSWLDTVYVAISGHTIQNVVIAAHHPIAMYKIKNGCKFHTTSDEYLELCYSIYSKLQRMKSSSSILRFFYSCADLHTYQSGIVTLSSGGIPINIHQEIAGTGGTALEAYVASIADVNSGNCVQKHASTVLVGYEMTNTVHSNGFLHWKIHRKSGNLTAQFIATHEPESSKSKHKSSRTSSGGTKRRSQRESKRHSKYRRRMRRSRSRSRSRSSYRY